MKKIFVVATMWNSEKEIQEKVIVGEFSRRSDASLFKNAYEYYYHTEAVIIDESELLNK